MNPGISIRPSKELRNNYKRIAENRHGLVLPAAEQTDGVE